MSIKSAKSPPGFTLLLVFVMLVLGHGSHLLAADSSKVSAAHGPGFGAWLNNRRSRVVPFRALAIGPRFQTAVIDSKTSINLDRKLGMLTVLERDQTPWRQNLSAIRPWKLETANVVGDGHREIVLGVYKKNRFFPYLHAGLYIYAWINRTLAPIWRGSNLSEPFIDFAFVPEPHADILAAVEIKASGRRCLATYRWQNFGFVRETRSGDWKRAKIDSVKNGVIVVHADGRKISLPIGTNKCA